MPRIPLLAAAALLLCAGAAVSAADKELSVSEFLDNLPSLLDKAPEPPEVSEAEVVELEEGDPETYIFIHGAGAHPPAPVNLGGDGRLTLQRPSTGERLTAAYRRKDGSYDQAALANLNRLLRCSSTGKETPVSIKLLEILDAVEDRFGSPWLNVLSGYRSPRFNREVPGAARRSLHMLGWAADIRVPGRAPSEVAEFAEKLKAGGVGHYASAAFVHLDSGRARRWDYKPPAPRKGAKPSPKK
jgi:uncharacterized protein YcbK (DUF882 family)